jgi:CheY-like chemotaxis protein
MTPRHEPSRAATPIILVVDDDRGIREALADALRDEGYFVRVAEDGREALAMIEASAPDLVLLDLIMPAVNGLQVIDALERTPRLARIPVFIVTAVPKAPEIRRGLPVFSKPLKLAPMMRTIRAFLRPDGP